MHRMVIIVAAADRTAANAQAAGLDADVGGDRTFGLALSSAGTLPASHYLTNVLVGDPARGAINGPLKTAFPTALVFDCDALGWDDIEAGTKALDQAALRVVNPALEDG